MGFDKVKVKQIRGLLLFAAAMVLVIWYSQGVFSAIGICVSIVQPFLIGGGIAFVLNIPMKGIEKLLFGKRTGKVAQKIKRPISLILAIILLFALVTLLVATVLPQIVRTAMDLGVQIPLFFDNVLERLEEVSASYPLIGEKIQELEQMQINWQSMLNSVWDFLKNGMGNVLTSAFSFTSSVIGGVVNGFISFIFAVYILCSKEKLGRQADNVIRAYFQPEWYDRIWKVCKLLYQNFSNFISGQCLEAVILGTMFVISMSILGLPYAVMIGVLIAFCALIPVVGAFAGCFIGAFLILMKDPMQAVWFVILFLVLQQIEGNLIYPRVVGNSVGLPSIWVLVAVSVGGSLFGIVGMLLFIPLVSTGYSLLRDNVRDRNQRKGIAPGDAIEQETVMEPASSNLELIENKTKKDTEIED